MSKSIPKRDRPQTGWGITTGSAGHDTKVLGLLERLVEDPRMIHVEPRGLAKWFAPHIAPKLGNNLSAPYPDIVITSGRRVAAYGQAIAAQSGANSMTVVLEDAGINPSKVDFIWANQHDPVTGPNVFKTLTAPHRLTTEKLTAEAQPLATRLGTFPDYTIGLILGGPSSRYSFTDEEARKLGEQVAALAQSRQAGVIITPSRRTPSTHLETIIKALNGTPHWVWNGKDQNPYFGMLGLCDEFVVTCDSSNMLGEAAFTGKPLHMAKLEGKHGKFSKLHAGLIKAGAARWLSDQCAPWHYAPIDSTPDIVNAIIAVYADRQQGRRP